ncbi:gamma-glutamylcyclotransferase family protein [Streptantibioticus parmotrematis]|uniref:gamma-glutamylcyclotransferase family protein n=1 Tax=Streptantibioticus parmotrematis TaxID=2873249 RepID=UPI0033F1FE9B
MGDPTTPDAAAPVLPFFVYGTLRAGQVNHDRVLRGRVAAPRPAELPGAVLYDGPGYPYALDGAAADIVRGELVEALPGAYDAVLADLDRLEEHVPGAPGNLYDRVTREVRCGGAPRPAWVYLAGPVTAAALRANGRRIASGHWPAGGG